MKIFSGKGSWYQFYSQIILKINMLYTYTHTHKDTYADRGWLNQWNKKKSGHSGKRLS